MNKKIVLLLVYAVAFTFLLGSPLKVSAESLYITLENWDSYNIGVSSGSNGLHEWERISGNDFEVTNAWSVSPSNSLYLYANTGTDIGDTGFFNLTYDYEYINSISFIFRMYRGNPTDSREVYFKFYNESDVEVLFLAYGNENGLGIGLQYDDVFGVGKEIPGSDMNNGIWYNRKLTVTHISGNTMNYTVSHINNSYIGGVDDSCRISADWSSFKYIYVVCEGAQNGQQIYIDDINISTSFDDDEETNAPFYFELYDIHSGSQLNIEGKGNFQGFCDSACGYSNYVQTYFYCPDLWSGDYPGFEGGCHGSTITVEGYNYDTGSKHQFGFLYPIGCVNGEVRGYTTWIKNVTLYPGRTYSIFLSEFGYDDENLIGICNMDRWGDEFGGDPFDTFFCIEFENYSMGQTLRTKYRLPTEYWMLHNGYSTENYEFQLHDKSKYPWENPVKTWDLSDYNGFTGDYETDFQIEVSTDNGFAEVPRQYHLKIASNLWNPWINSPDFFVGTDEWDPSGEILSVNPDPPAYGQETQISFIANNTCKLKLTNPGSGFEEWSEEYLYSTQTHFYHFNPLAFGYWNVELFVEVHNESFVLVDNYGFTVVNDSGEPGEPAYNVEYLYIPDYRIIAGGNQTVNIQYRILSAEGWLNITSPRDEQTPYSTSINASGRQHVFTLKPPIPLGTWNVSMVGQNTFYSTFNVIAEENNYVEFVKNEYYEDEPFTVLLKHSYYVALRFYKDDIAVGESWRLREGQYPFETNLPVPYQYARPSVGNWRVELWRVNQELQMYKLAEWSCRVIPSPATDDGIPDQNELGEIVGGLIPYPYDIMVGSGIIIGLIFLPIALVMGFNREFKTKIEIKSEIMIYMCIMTGFIGYVLTIVWGIFPWWTVFTLLFALILIFAIKWYGHKSPAGE